MKTLGKMLTMVFIMAVSVQFAFADAAPVPDEESNVLKLCLVIGLIIIAAVITLRYFIKKRQKDKKDN